jgi:hypothetical protein
MEDDDEIDAMLSQVTMQLSRLRPLSSFCVRIHLASGGRGA